MTSSRIVPDLSPGSGGGANAETAADADDAILSIPT